MNATEHTRLRFKYAPKAGMISVIVPVHKDAEGLRDTLKSLSEQTLPENRYEVIVGNDGADPACSAVCKEFSFVHEVGTADNQGAYAIRNLAAEASHGEFIAFTDADIRVPKHWLECFLKHFERGADYIGGEVAIDPTKVKTLTHRLTAEYEFKNKSIFTERRFTPTANMAVRRSVLESIGGFDRRFYSSGDYEFGDRVYRDGKYRQVFAEEIVVTHPPRTYSAFMKKLARISGGEADLKKYYPERFAGRHDKSLYRKFREALYFQEIKNHRGLLDKTLLTLLAVWFQLWRAYNDVLNARAPDRKRPKQ